MKFEVTDVNKDEIPRYSQGIPQELKTVINNFLKSEKEAIQISLNESDDTEIIRMYYKIKNVVKGKATLQKSGKSLIIKKVET